MIKIIKQFVICTLLTGLSFNTFAEDIEPNNTLTEASSLGIGTNAAGTANDEDWYQIAVAPGNTHIQINLSHLNAEGDLDIELWDAFGNKLNWRDSSSDNEAIDHDVGTAGTYYITVYNYSTFTGQSYSLVWNSIAASDDYYEENDHKVSAYNYTLNNNTWLSSLSGAGISRDFDYYEINVTTGNTLVQVELQHTHSQGDLGIEIYDPDGNSLVWSNGTIDNESIDYDVGTSGTYFILVYNNDGYTGQAYDLLWNAIAPTTTTPPSDDAYEENDDLASAYDHTSNEGIWLDDSTLFGTGISNDYDYYEINVTTGYTRVQIELHHTHSHGDLGLELFDASGNSLVWSNGSIDNESIDYDVGTGGTYYILIYNLDGYTGQFYNLWWDDLLATTTPPTTDDVYEENDTLSTAISLAPNSPISGISNDEDWYKIIVTAGNTSIQVDLSWSGTADVDLELYDAAGNPLATSWFGSNVENIDIDVFNAGTYYILVDTYTSYIDTSYNLSWNSTATTVISGGDDIYESNNLIGDAYLLSNNTAVNQLLGISSDEDWYQISIPAGQRLEVDLLFTHVVNGDLDLTLYAPNGDEINGAFSSDDNEFFDYTSTANGLYYIKITTWTGDGETYSGVPYEMKYSVIDPSKATTADTTTTSNTKGGIISGGGGGGGGGGSLSYISLLLIPLVTLLRRKLRS